MDAEGKGGKPADVLDLLPHEFQNKDVKRRLRRLTSALDELVFEDNGDMFVDADGVERLLRDDDVFPRDVRERVRKGVDKHLGQRVRTRGKNRAVKWQDVTRREPAIAPMSVEELRDLGINASISGEEAKRIFAEHFPDFPREILDADGARLREIAVRGIEHNRTVWDCVVSKIGYWVALGVFAAFGALLIIGTATGPFGVPLAIFLAATLGGGTAVIVANCVLNPNL